MSSDAGDARDAGPRAIVIGHGDFAPGLISAVDQITGRGSQLTPLVVRDLGLAEIEQAILEAMESTGARVVFTDLHGGSCASAARRALRPSAECVLVAGANLPMLLDFVLGASNGDAASAARQAAERGRSAVIVREGGK